MDYCNATQHCLPPFDEYRIVAAMIADHCARIQLLHTRKAGTGCSSVIVTGDDDREHHQDRRRRRDEPVGRALPRPGPVRPPPNRHPQESVSAAKSVLLLRNDYHHSVVISGRKFLRKRLILVRMRGARVFQTSVRRQHLPLH